MGAWGVEGYCKLFLAEGEEEEEDLFLVESVKVWLLVEEEDVN